MSTPTDHRPPTPLDWMMSAKTGISSKTIMHVMEGTAQPRMHTDVPYDPDDFGRCHELLLLFPSYRPRLPEVAARYPAWTALVREWDRLDALYDARDYIKLYDAMQPLIDEGRIAAGWVKKGAGYWVKEVHP